MVYFTDGSYDRIQDVSGYSVWCPKRHLAESWKLAEACSSTTTELCASERTLDIMKAYEAQDNVLVYILINTIMQKHEDIRNSNKHILKLWIPSHVGIAGNERADSLAKLGHTSSLVNNHSYNSIEEILQEIKKNINKTTITKLDSVQSPTNKINATMRTGMGPLPWHLIFSTPINHKLHRLRSGHNKLSPIMAKINDTIDSQCRTCHTSLSPEHIILQCPNFSTRKKQIETNNTKAECRLYPPYCTWHQFIDSHNKPIRHTKSSFKMFFVNLNLIGQKSRVMEKAINRDTEGDGGEKKIMKLHRSTLPRDYLRFYFENFTAFLRSHIYVNVFVVCSDYTVKFT
ncbi:hypothetical protein GHT06_018388 [Daphnia sinensis]|uniref:RNase H type-1 domain-containing protein n=1 Tax=Daphnia sinensis TaxID=1820382 RepID=A0AAD5PQ44_9CRUS|nr:hypothetical protein GHT06_018388 [Daphnia sinensis]